MSSRAEDEKFVMRIFIIITAIVLIAATIVTIQSAGPDYASSSGIKVGYVTRGSVTEEGWDEQNFNGILNACKKYKAKLIVKENVEENTGACSIAVQELVHQGATIIFLSSFQYAHEIKDLIRELKNVQFLANYTDLTLPNLSIYLTKLYQARYLSGIIAGLETKTNSIGYVAAMSNSEVNRGISAFALGVQRVNPQAQVFVRYTNSWDDKDKESEALKYLAEKANVDVVTYHQNQPNVVYEAEKMNIKSIGYHIPVSGCSENYLTSVVSNWNVVYETALKNAITGRNSVKSYYWFGVETGAVRLSALSPLVNDSIKQELYQAQLELREGKALFSGELYDNAGKCCCHKDELLSDMDLLENFDWLVRGVTVYED